MILLTAGLTTFLTVTLTLSLMTTRRGGPLYRIKVMFLSLIVATGSFWMTGCDTKDEQKSAEEEEWSMTCYKDVSNHEAAPDIKADELEAQEEVMMCYMPDMNNHETSTEETGDEQ